jgi:hypothetical protein
MTQTLMELVKNSKDRRYTEEEAALKFEEEWMKIIDSFEKNIL